MAEPSKTPPSPLLYLFGDDFDFKTRLATELARTGLGINSSGTLDSDSVAPDHLAAWIMTDMLLFGDDLVQILSKPEFLPGKIFLIFPLDRTQSSQADVNRYIQKIDGYINQYRQICRTKQIDLRCLAHHGLFYPTKLGEGTSVNYLSQADPSLFYPFSLDSSLGSIVRLWFDRGHKSQTVVLRGPQLTSPLVSASPSVPPSQFWPGPSALSFDDSLEITSDLEPLTKLIQPPTPPKRQSPPAPQVARVARTARVVQPPAPSPRPPNLVKKYSLIALTASFVAYLFVTYGLFLITLAQTRRFNPGAGESLSVYETRLTQGLARYQKLSLIPVLDHNFSATTLAAQKLLLSRQLNQLAADSLSIFLGSKSGNFHQQLAQIKVLLDQLYSLEATTDASPGELARLTDLRDLVQVLPQLLPETRKITLLILLQNNLELRPTGGFIGSVALATIDHGQLLTLETRDIYDLDGNLHGIVTPPAEISRYLSESSWYFRDSNWNPDFNQAATSANWFLGKEWGSQADLILGLNLNTFLPLLSALGGLNLPDGTNLNSANLLITGLNYQDTAAGSANQPEYLATIFKPLIQRITQETDPGLKLKILEGLYQSLQSGDLTLASTDSKLAPILDDLRLSGTIYRPLCLNSLAQPCLADQFYLNEANMGINKANYYLERRTTHRIDIASNIVTHRHDLSLTNTSPGNTWPAGAYKSYFRAYLPFGATNLQVFRDNVPLSATDLAVTSTAAFQVVGWYLVVNPQTAVQVSLSYQLPLPPGAQSYQFFLEKQPGLLPGPLNYTLTTPVKTLTNSVEFAQPLFLSAPLVP